VRVVFDTNIFISAFVFPGGQAEQAILKVLEGNDHLLISKDIIDEVLTVLARKFNRNAEALAHTAVFLSEIAEMVKPSVKIKVLKEPPDNRILECAVYGRADIIVTGDKEMLNLKHYQGVKILSLREYLRL
jgi:putative PIN family toxin of toxin-antitoxin system